MKNEIDVQTETIREEMDKPIKIVVAKTAKEQQQLFHFRYQVYVEEMGKRPLGADYTNKLIKDEMDDWGWLIYAEVDSQIIGTARLNIGMSKQFPLKIVSIFSMPKFDEFFNNNGLTPIGLATKVIVSPKYRNSSVFYLLVMKLYEKIREQQIDFCFGGCNPYLLSFYEKLGFRRYTQGFTDCGYGYLLPIVLIAEDIDHIRSVRSPFYRLARKCQNSPAARNWFLEEFPECTKFINSQTISDEDYWLLLLPKLGQEPSKAISLFRTLTDDEIKKLLRISILVPFSKSECVATCGDISRELNILLSGIVKTKCNGQERLIQPGQHFGEIGLLEYQKQKSDVTTVTNVEVLILPYHGFAKLRHQHPIIGTKVCNWISATQATWK